MSRVIYYILELVYAVSVVLVMGQGYYNYNKPIALYQCIRTYYRTREWER
jgi:hypothetical protein